MRYVVALAVAGVLIAALLVYARSTVAAVESRVRDQLREQLAAGDAPPELREIDPATADIREFGVQLPPSEMSRLQFARWLLDFWLVWATAVVVLCVMVALLTRRTSPAEPTS